MVICCVHHLQHDFLLTASQRYQLGGFGLQVIVGRTYNKNVYWLTEWEVQGWKDHKFSIGSQDGSLVSQLPILSRVLSRWCNSSQGCLHSHSCPVGEKQVFPCSLKRVKTLPGNLQQLFPWVFFGQNWNTCILPLIFLGCSVPRISHFLFTLVIHSLKLSTNIYWLATMCWG